MMRTPSRFLILFVGALAVWPALCRAQPACPPATASGAEVLEAIGRGEVARWVRCGLDLNRTLQVDGEPMTPLGFAASLGKAEIVAQLVRAGADPNYAGTDKIVLYPLEIALSGQKFEAARELLERGAKADYVTPTTGSTALMALAFYQGAEGPLENMTRALLKKGAQLDAADAKGNTALHWAARAGNTGYARILLRLGADGCLANQKRSRPADVVAPARDAALSGLLARACPAARPTPPTPREK